MVTTLMFMCFLVFIPMGIVTIIFNINMIKLIKLLQKVDGCFDNFGFEPNRMLNIVRQNPYTDGPKLFMFLFKRKYLKIEDSEIVNLSDKLRKIGVIMLILNFFFMLLIFLTNVIK